MAVEWVEQNVLSSPEYVAGHAPDAWVGEVYQAVLGRSPAPGEAAYWTGRLAALGSDRLALVREVWYTPEGVGHRVISHYQHLLGRTPSAGEVDYWRAGKTRSDLATSIAFATSTQYSTLVTEIVQSDGQGEAAAVHAFLADLSAARWRAAYDMLSASSQAAIGGYPGFYASRTALGEGLAAFAAVPVGDYLVTGWSEGSIAVVVPGTVTREGVTAFDTASFGVHPFDADAGGDKLDVFLRSVGSSITPASHVLPRGSALGVSADPRGLKMITELIVDGRPLGTSALSANGDLSLVPDPPLAPGRHVATVLASLDDGTLQVESTTITVPPGR